MTQLILTIHTNKNIKVPIISCKNIQNEIICKAIKDKKPLSYKATFGLGNTPYGCIPWMLITFYLREQIEKSQPLYWLNFYISPKDLTEILTEWYTLLQHQSVFFIFIKQDNSVLHFPLLTQVQLSKFITILDSAVSLWKSSNDFLQAATYYHPQLILQKELLEKLIKVEDNPKQDNELLLLQAVARTAVAYLSPKDPLYQAASTSNLSILNNYLQEWSRQISLPSLNNFLATPGFNGTENFCKDWLFAYECIKQSKQKSKKILYIATGISTTGSWCLRSLPNFKLYGDEMFLYAKIYRYLLRHTWTKLLTSNDIVIGETALLKFSNFSVVPQCKQFDEVTRILQLAALEKQFDIEKRISIEVGKVGCQEIEFLPLQTDLKCLFKVVTHKHPQENLCLVGELDALKGSIAFAGTPQEESVQGHLRLLLFIVALAYRDLIVARECISKEVDISYLSKSSKYQKYTSINSKQNSTRIILGFKGKIDSSFADPKRFIEQLHKVSPHIRLAHLRQLPEQYQISEYQKQLAQEYGWILPEGYTFVRATQINTPEIADLNEVRQRFRSLSLMELFFSDF